MILKEPNRIVRPTEDNKVGRFLEVPMRNTRLQGVHQVAKATSVDRFLVAPYEMHVEFIMRNGNGKDTASTPVVPEIHPATDGGLSHAAGIVPDTQRAIIETNFPKTPHI